MSVEILQPFQLDSNGQIATTTDPNVQVDQHLLTLVSTQPGERIMVPSYGVPTFGTLFTNDTVTNQQVFQGEVKNALSTWEPGVTATVQFKNEGTPQGSNYFNGRMDVQIDWTSNNPLSNSTNGVLTATVLVGGTVVADK